jgi:protein-S-isoprenylcysteine O-methyltransferase Ste14
MILRHPLLVFALSLFILWTAAIIGSSLRKRRSLVEDGEREDFTFIVASTLTLLGLIIGFSFSMAIGRYDQRKNLEAEEANKIGTEYLRLDFFPANDAAKLRELLRSYLDQRILFYEARDINELPKINADTERMQSQLWSGAQVLAAARPSPLTGLAISGMNDVLDSQGYAQAAWWNRIPVAAWCLMFLIAICCNLLVGFGAHASALKPVMLGILPIVVSLSFFLIADIDSPRGGIIRVHPRNLESLARFLTSQ